MALKFIIRRIKQLFKASCISQSKYYTPLAFHICFSKGGNRPYCFAELFTLNILLRRF